MNKTTFVAFVAGLAIGSVATWQYAKKKYELIAQEEIDSVKEVFSKKAESNDQEDAEADSDDVEEAREKAKRAKEKANVAEYAAILKKENYVDYNNIPLRGVEGVAASDWRDGFDKIHAEKYGYVPDDEDNEEDDIPYVEEEKIEDRSEKRPYVIPPEEFGEMDGYSQVSLTFYADNVLTDEYDRIIPDVDKVVGFDSLSHFGEYEDDSVFVRNDRLKCDYEILADQRTYFGVVLKEPYKAEI